MSSIDFLVGKRILRRRIELGYDPTKLAHALGVSAQELAQYESGMLRPTPVVLVQITQELDISIAWLFAEPASRTVELIPEAVKEPAELDSASNYNAPAADAGIAPPSGLDQSESAK